MKKSSLYPQKQSGNILMVALIFVAIIAAGFVAFRVISAKTGIGVKVDVANPPKFIQADFIDLSKIYSISKFRSAEGHDFSGNGETCRSMKHYFTPQIDTSIKPQKAADGRSIPPQPDGAHDINIYSPVDGTITDIAEERLPVGEQLYIKPTSAQDYTVRLFHVYKVAGINKGVTVKAGQKIGVISGYSATDIAIEGGREQYVSYFQVMPDKLFAAYQQRGVKTRDEIIITKADRDANPVPCNQDKSGDQSFQYPSGYRHEADNVYLSGYIKPDYTQQQQGQHNLN